MYWCACSQLWVSLQEEDATDDSESKVGQVSSAENPPKPATDKEVRVEKVG